VASPSESWNESFDGRLKPPGSGRSTSDAAVSELKKEIARRNEDAQKAARKLRAERERKLLAQRREWDR
jgi:hypothetical protein